MSANTTALTPKQREAIYEAWIAALRSGLYKQGRNYLELDGKFCCLGVLCHVLHQRPELGIEMDRFVIPDAATTYSTHARPGRLNHVPDSIADELGLSTRRPSAAYRVVEVVLADLNDVEGASFSKIAQVIEGSVMPLLRAEGILPPAQQEAPAAHHRAGERAMTDRYEEWRNFYAKHVSSWMSLEELRAECGKLQTVDATSPELLLIHAMHALEECVQRDEALLRQALEALEKSSVDTPYGNGFGLERRADERAHQEAVAALRERLGEGEPR